MKKDISANLYQKCLILCSKILLDVLHNEYTIFATTATYWVPDLPDITGFASHLGHSISISANGASSVWSSKHIDMLGHVCGLVKCFLSLK